MELSNILSIIATVISLISIIIAFFQNRKLHNENQALQVKPDLCVELLFYSKILGWEEKQSLGTLTAINVYKTQYTPYYTHHDIRMDKLNEILFTLCISNKGKGPADGIVVSNIQVKTNTDATNEFTSSDILFSCAETEKKATRIYSELSPENVKEVRLQIKYKDMLDTPYVENFTFVPIDEKQAELKEINHAREVM